MPSWFEHADLMNVIIGILFLLVGWFVRREFSRFDSKLQKMCEEISNKADKKEVNKVWKRVNTHGHKLICSGKTCKPETAEDSVLLHDEG